MENTGHHIDLNSAELVFKSGVVGERLVVESALIKKVKNMNNTEGAVSIDNYASELIIGSNHLLQTKIDSFIPD